MKNWFKKILLLTMSMICASSLIGFSSWATVGGATVEDSIAYKNVGGRIDNYLVNGSTEESSAYASFTSLEGAVTSANAKSSGTTKVNMYLTVGSFITTTSKDIVLNSGVSLYMPYNGKTYNISSDSDVASLKDGFIDTTDANIKKYMVSSITLVSSTITISSGATLFIGGKFRQMGVSDVYSQIFLDSNSHISVSGSLYCDGYIKEVNNSNVSQNNRYGQDLFFNSFDSNRYINVLSGGYFSTPIAFYDAGGLSELTGLNSKGVFPINVFDFPNAQTFLNINSGATFDASARMTKTASSQTFNVNASLTIVKPSSSSAVSLISLATGSISFEYCPLIPGYTKNDASDIFIVINGQATLGYLTITVNSVDISTKDTFLPISHKMQFVVGSSGNLSTSTYKVKFMGGSSMKVLSGGVLNNGSAMIAYKSNSVSGIIDYPTTFGDASIVINGTFSMSSSATFGGHIKTTTTNGTALLNLSSIAQSSLNCSSQEGLSQSAIKLFATGDFYDSSSSSVVSYLLKAARTTYSDNTGKAVWQSGGNLVSYTLSIVVNNSNNYEHPLLGYMVYEIDSSGNESLLSTDGIYMTTASDYPIESGMKIKVISLDRAEKTEITKQTNTSYVFTSGNQYSMLGNLEITITPAEGVLVEFSVDGESGSGGSTSKFYESLTSGGTYYQVGQTSTGTTVDVAIKKNAYVKYEFTQGQCNNTLPGDHYLFAGITIDSKGNRHTYSDSDKTSGTKLTTTINDVGYATGALSGGSTSVSTNTQITGTSSIHAYIETRSSGGCFAEGTPILMADGTYRNIENVQVGDRIMVMNHDTGVLEAGIAAYIFENEISSRPVMRLSFENGKSIEVLYGHCFFNLEEKKYIELRPENVNEYIGKQFFCIDENTGSGCYTRLASVDFYNKNTSAYAIVSAYQMNCVANGFVNITDDIAGLYNYFDYKDNLQYDMEQKEADIQKYGLYTYDEWSDFFTMEEFDLFNIKYLKISVGKGLLTEETIKNYVNLYFR